MFSRRRVWELGDTVEWYWQEQTNNSEKKLFQCHFFTTNPTYIDSGANPYLRSERQATNRQNSGAAMWN
jgi:hypothetical protein